MSYGGIVASVRTRPPDAHGSQQLDCCQLAKSRGQDLLTEFHVAGANAFLSVLIPMAVLVLVVIGIGYLAWVAGGPTLTADARPVSVQPAA